jgi:hyaluronan synthase
MELSIVYTAFILVTFSMALYYRMRYADGHKEINATVIVSAYNEDQELLKDTIQRIKETGAKYVLIDDCSITPIEGADIRNCPNAGKKTSQYIALDKISADTDYIVSIDSDTRISHDAIKKAVFQFDQDTGAVVGNVTVKDFGLFQYIIGCLYWNSFNIGRAIGSLFGQVSVCSGAFTVYRADLFRKYIKESLQRPIRGGEDRYITYLILRDGYKTKYAHTAVAETVTPTGGKFLKQQLRWSKSFWRGLVYSKNAYRKNIFLFIYNSYTAIARVLNILAFGGLIGSLAIGEFKIAMLILLAALFHGFVRSLYGMIVLRDIRFLLFSFWGVFSLIVIAPLNIWAIITLKQDKWGNR